ncbi:MAG: hypothetical protein ACETWQ_04965 [Phycisphaerae bacterium]
MTPPRDLSTSLRPPEKYWGRHWDIPSASLRAGSFGKLKAGLPTTDKQKPEIKSTPSASSGQALRQAQGRGLNIKLGYRCMGLNL